MHNVKDIAQALSGRYEGDPSVKVGGVAEPQFSKPTDIAVALSQTFLGQLHSSPARVALLPEGEDWASFDLDAAIFVSRGRLAMAGLTRAFDPMGHAPVGIHPTAVVDPETPIGADASIGPFVVIDATANIGTACRIGSHVTIGPDVTIGDNAIIADGCRIGRNVSIGDNVQLQPNVVLGCDGFSYVTEHPAHVEIARKTLGEGAPPVLDDASWHKIYALGGVLIGDDVEIGAGSTVDAGTLRPTQIGRGTKIDNLVHIGHNVVIGEDCLFCAQSGIAGSATVGDRTVVGGQAGIADNISIGADVVLGGGSGVLSNVPAGRVMLGYPATKMAKSIESYQALRRLPRILDRLKAKD